MAYMKLRPNHLGRRLGTGLLIAWHGLVVVFVILSPLPPKMMDRFWLGVIALAIAGIPYGIKYGSQDKFWTG
jgi:hypothetical protein